MNVAYWGDENTVIAWAAELANAYARDELGKTGMEVATQSVINSCKNFSFAR